MSNVLNLITNADCGFRKFEERAPNAPNAIRLNFEKSIVNSFTERSPQLESQNMSADYTPITNT